MCDHTQLFHYPQKRKPKIRTGAILFISNEILLSVC